MDLLILFDYFYILIFKVLNELKCAALPGLSFRF